MAETAGARRGWGDALAVYLNRRVIAMAFLGFSAGLPFLLIFGTLSAWLTEADVSRTTIGFFSWVGITYSIKVFWAPVVDRLPLPILNRVLGRRRSWMLVAQITIALGLFLMAHTDPAQNLERVALLAFLVAFASATQDIAVDAYRIEAVNRDLQGAMAATYQGGYRIGVLLAGAGALYLAEFYSWPVAYMVMAAAMGIGVVTVAVIREPEVEIASETRAREAKLFGSLGGDAEVGGQWRRLAQWFAGAVVAPFVDFFARNGTAGLIILAFVGLYRLSDINLGIMANPFYLDMGFTKAEIANVTKVFGVLMTMAGAFLGGLLVARYGILRPLLLGALLVPITNLLFIVLALSGPDLALLTMTIGADNLSAGLAGSAFIAYLSSLTNTAYTATQYALFSSLFTLPGKLVGGFSGVVVDAAGYPVFFAYASALGLPAIVLVLVLMARARRSG
ncbi:MAG: AmpG family muropeptide MFS transporter [Pseudomonadota bacterium]